METEEERSSFLMNRTLPWSADLLFLVYLSLSQSKEFASALLRDTSFFVHPPSSALLVSFGLAVPSFVLAVPSFVLAALKLDPACSSFEVFAEIFAAEKQEQGRVVLFAGLSQAVPSEG